MLTGNSPSVEISRQLDLLTGERWSRNFLSVLALCLTALYLPLWLVAICVVGHVASDLIGMRYMRALSPTKHPKRYRAVTGLAFLREFFYTLAAAFLWQYTETYGQFLAIGMVMAQMLQLAMMRAIHLPFGYAGMSAATLLIFTSNTYYWLNVDNNPMGLVFSTVAAVAVIAYSLTVMHSNHRLHSNFASDRAAALAGEKAKGRFLAQMSHELRTPLNAILGMGHAEQRRNKDALSQTRLSVLIAAAEGLSTILDDILDMSAIEAGRLPIRPQAVVPNDEIHKLLALFQPAINAAGLDLNQDFGTGLDREWMFDPQRLRQCLSNLLSNALKNTKHGAISVTVRLDEKQIERPYIWIEIADTGSGIPSHLHRAVFEPFSQVRRPQVETESNGLGLSICRTMARHMGGDLTIAPNTEGKSGARFILTLALARAPARQPITTAPSALPAGPSEAEPTRGTKGLKVLVIDDIATNRLVASTYLRMLGATMIEAASGAQALEILDTFLPDLVLLDMNMPQMNGLQTLEKIRALPGAVSKIPVIAMTADAMADQRALYISSGIDGYLAKPINPARIEAEIKAVLGNAGQGQPSPPD